MKSIILNMDGNQVVATWDGFTNLQECVAGFGDTIKEAVLDLFSQDEAYCNLIMSKS